MKLLSAFLFASSLVTLADVRLPALISDNMVLLQDGKSNVWGWAEPGEKVTIQLGEKTVSAAANAQGKWSAKLEGLKAGSGMQMTVAGKNSITIQNVAVGEVWLASGQSNMEFLLSAAKDGAKEVAACQDPEIRVFTVAKKPSGAALEDVSGKWEVATPENAPHFSAVGYFFIREVRQKLKVPVGLIASSWGGTPLESWLAPSIMRPEFSAHWQKLKHDYPEAQKAFQERARNHPQFVEQAKVAGQPVPAAPRAPYNPSAAHFTPNNLYRGMIAPVTPYTIRGALWYQGESNAGPKNTGCMDLYGQLLESLIESWRAEFGKAQGVDSCEFTFLVVQLANFGVRRPEPSDSYWAQIREAQLGVLKVPRTGMAVAIDVGEAADIHPRNKQDVGRRLALAALAQVYLQKLEFSGPLFTGMKVEKDKIRVSFSHGEGLQGKDGGALKGFAIAGEDRKFVWADARVEGDHIVLSNPEVKAPVAARYGWADNPECNLVNKAGLPASPFRTDNWPQNPPEGSQGVR